MILKHGNVSNLRRGKVVNIVIDFVLKEEITSGQITVKVNYEQIPVINLSMDFCDIISLMDKQCPLQKGDFLLKFHRNIPGSVPSVSIQILII